MQIEWDQDYLLPKVIRSLLTLQPRVHAGEACTKEAEMEPSVGRRRAAWTFVANQAQCCLEARKDWAPPSSAE